MKHRQQRVAHEIRDRLAAIVEREVSDPRLSGLTITAVELSRDLSFARVWYRTLDDVEAVAAALEHATPFVRRRLAEGLRLRRVPELRFLRDESPERGARVEALLEELAAERAGRAERDRESTDEEEPA